MHNEAGDQRSNQAPASDEVRAPLSFLAARSIKRHLLFEHRQAWENGNKSKLDEFVPRWPGDLKDDRDYASFLFQDYHQRRQRGEQPSVDDYAQRFPEHRESLSQLISRHDVMMSFGDPSGSEGPRLGLPEVGHEVFGFQLKSELGRGAFARVFLAEQADLARRPVVLKVSGIEGDEPYTLAQLQHTNVVPIHSIHEDILAGLRVLCMPYFGGASLSSVLRDLWQRNAHPVAGNEIVTALKAVESPPIGQLERATTSDGSAKYAQSDGEPRAGSTPLHRLCRLTYANAVAWILAQLADGLQHAHDRGVLHRDIKPSNILLGADGQPMLLDFNLAQRVDGCPSKAEAALGGTVAYMAPEHLRALANPTAATVRHVDHRSDIYSLGMVLFEMLTGHSPFEQSASYSVLPILIEAMALERSQAAPSVRKKRAQTPWGMESIVRKCLSPDPVQRYQHANELADDLRRFIGDQPLKFAPELSQCERVRKWMRRHPRLTSTASVATVAAVLLIGAGAALAGVRDHLADTREKLATEEAYKRQREFEAGTIRAQCLVNTVTDLEDHLNDGMAVCEQTLALYGVLEHEHWQATANWQRLDESTRQRLAEDTRELLAFLAWARVKLNPGDSQIVHQALLLLDRAERIQGLPPSKAMWMDRTIYLDKLGKAEEARAARATAEKLSPASARDHYLVATAFARKGDVTSLQKAIAELTAALDLNPRHYWSWVQRGICYQELGEPTLAASDFGTCIGLWPEFAWGFFNRGYTLSQVGQKAEAINSFTEALERDSTFLPAYVNRGLARLELKQHAPALADFDKALQTGRTDAYLYAGRGVALEGLGRFADADEAFHSAFSRTQTDAPAVRNRIRWVYGFAVCARLPEQARTVFEELLREEANQPQALYGLGMLAAERENVEDAISYFDRALAAHPGFIDARRHRAILWARQAEFTHAMQDINWCLEREPRNGATLYAAACVAARAAERTLDPAVTNQAIDLLEKAFARGYGRDRAATDPDLAALRKHPTLRKLLGEGS